MQFIKEYPKAIQFLIYLLYPFLTQFIILYHTRNFQSMT